MLPSKQIVAALADQIVRCGGCKVLFNRTGMVADYKGEVWCAWCIARDQKDDERCEKPILWKGRRC